MADTPLYSVMSGPSALAIKRILEVLFPDAITTLDMTFGKGNFWSPKHPVNVSVTGLDRDPERARDVCGDFTQVPFLDASFDVAIFDPPYLTEISKTNPSTMSGRFGSFETDEDLVEAVKLGCEEAWRVSRVGVIVKVQNHTHQNRSVRMTKWVEGIFPVDAYGEVHTVRLGGKIKSPRWEQQLSVYSKHATYLSFRHGDQRHVRRGGQKERKAS